MLTKQAIKEVLTIEWLDYVMRDMSMRDVNGNITMPYHHLYDNTLACATSSPYAI